MCGVCAPAGGLPRRCRRGGCQRYPAGGVPALSPACPAFRFLFCPLSPRPPSRREGGDFLFSYARGFAPCIPGAEPARHWFALPLWKTQWGLASALPTRRMSAAPGGGAGRRSPADLAAAVFAGGACLLCRLPTLPLAYFSAPIPPQPPSPPGKGETLGYFYARGFAPCIPGAEPTARRKTDRKRFPTRVPPGFNRRRACLPGTVSAASGLMPGVPGAEPPAKST